MDCPICNCSMSPVILRPVRYTVCGACYEGAKSIINWMNKLDNDKKVNKSSTNITSLSALIGDLQGMANALKWMKEIKEMEDELNEKLNFLGGFISAFRDQIHTDIQVKPGNGGPSIPAHRALLAARSDIFGNMLDSDEYMAQSSDIITLPELDYEQLQALLEFLYCGHLPKEKVEKHVYSLSVAADKYEIPFLQRFCEHHMLGSLNSFNALDVLEISDTCYNLGLKEATLNFIIKNMQDIVFSARFDSFALKNPHLSVQITRASFMDIKSRRVGA
ncbi:unnamed protein product [Ilex paraguariensis]|uniref:BTB domain-containing protein n=1 Tax=Ilex paraguariensis TaxID=185542 RepID=A0ABC8QTE0_9AQUA